MRLSTTTNIFRRDENDNYIPVTESMRKSRKIGFEVLDITVAMAKEVKDHPLNGDKWEEWIYNIANEAQKLGVEFSQAHLPFYLVSDPMFNSTEGREFYNKAMHRCIHTCGILGVKWAVAHIFHSVEDQCFAPKVKKDNMKFYEPIVEAAKKNGFGIAFENMIPATRKCTIRYPVTHWELIDFIDTWNDPMVGICWDFGHANMTYNDQAEPLYAIGKRLKALHVHDNFGKGDMHYAPFLGTINWKSVMQALKDIGYEGDFTLELGNFAKRKPEAVQNILAKCAYDIGTYLLNTL